MKQSLFIFLMLLGFSMPKVLAQEAAISFPALEIEYRKSPKPVIVFLHAPWCKFCDNMKQTTFEDEAIKNILSKDFYFASFDGESKGDVEFMGKTFKYKPTGANTGVHELAEQLGTKNGMVSYPTVVFLNDKLEIIYQNDGFLSAKNLKKMLAKLSKELEASN
ncbi:thioredoxin family protein [Roseivirga misakiensis]|uniref:Thioredoxin domain-containing protein n=1 Tax=Roseivirga misakiensis TaxID=1563681 RepID=A0A1E5SLE4_9BACT|nr:thioredoxin family protein [Roseivirga misakiensis]OEJ99866.1 hypothetical protein BFP71_09970 [Roseivirga misakiensis]